MKSGIAMVQVSGTKVRALREEQNLTQLYVATAVGVTTETISRWERQEAPTLKEENGIKLADALAVSLSEILVVPEEKAEQVEAVSPVSRSKKTLLFIAANVLLLGVLLFFIITFRSADVLQLSAQRRMPAHTVSGHPFPVVVEVVFESGKDSSLLFKEQLAAGCNVVASMPQATVVDGGFLKWIDKDGPGKRVFSYIARCVAREEAENEPLSFTGTLLVRQSSREEITVDGRSRIRLLEFHWADSDKNNIIDDEELLAVYDDFGRVEGLGVNVEEVESIWMGSGYRWEAKLSTFDIIP